MEGRVDLYMRVEGGLRLIYFKITEASKGMFSVSFIFKPINATI